MSSGPRIGDTVHYRSYGTPGGEYQPECRAAIVTAIRDLPNSKTVGLCVLNPTGMFFNDAAWDEDQRGGTWHYQCAVYS